MKNIELNENEEKALIELLEAIKLNIGKLSSDSKVVFILHQNANVFIKKIADATTVENEVS